MSRGTVKRVIAGLLIGFTRGLHAGADANCAHCGGTIVAGKPVIQFIRRTRKGVIRRIVHEKCSRDWGRLQDAIDRDWGRLQDAIDRAGGKKS
jgi:hypothetical protein